jgi:phosphoribosyl 1,2-cyclic phosphodiesterase
MGQIRFVDFSELAAIFTGVMEAASMPLAHPGGSAAYSIAMEGARVCTLFDNEYAAAQEAQLADFVDGSDLVSWDGMFLEEELQMRRGWGHSSIEEGVDFFTRTGARQMALMHHAPSRTDQQLDSLQDGLKQDKIFFAHQNQTIELQGSRRPDTR